MLNGQTSALKSLAEVLTLMHFEIYLTVCAGCVQLYRLILIRLDDRHVSKTQPQTNLKHKSNILLKGLFAEFISILPHVLAKTDFGNVRGFLIIHSV